MTDTLAGFFSGLSLLLLPERQVRHGGMTLGGGYGLLSDKYGTACDNLLSAAPARSDTIEPVSYHAFQRPIGSPPPGMRSTVRTAFLPQLSDGVIDAISRVVTEAPANAFYEIAHLHGAVSRSRHSKRSTTLTTCFDSMPTFRRRREDLLAVGGQRFESRKLSEVWEKSGVPRGTDHILRANYRLILWTA